MLVELFGRETGDTTFRQNLLNCWSGCILLVDDFLGSADLSWVGHVLALLGWFRYLVACP